MDNPQPLILADVRQRTGYLILNRTSGLNALNLEMVRALRTHLERWIRDEQVRLVVLRSADSRAFSVGGDVRALCQAYQAGDRDAVGAFFSEEYQLDQLIHTYPKPVIALLDGYVFGGGLGLAQGALTIATRRSRLGMPETAIGFFPDVGASFFLSRLPGALGAYLGLTGIHLSAADARQAGLVDILVDDDCLGSIETVLADFNGSDQVFSNVESQLRSIGQVADGGLETLRPAIDRHFAGRNLHEICESLRQEQDPNWRDWASSTLELLEQRSPLAMAVTLELLRRGGQLNLTECFALELHLGKQWFERGDIVEGVRALLIDKDKQPRWKVKRIEQVDGPMVEAFFEGFEPY